MYRYDAIDREILADRVQEFREQCARRLSGELTEDQFKRLRLMNGLYLQLHSYMLRIAIPYGALSSAQLRKLGFIAGTYDKGYGHFTTRTNLQLHWIKLKDAPDILGHLADVGMHAIQTSGNDIRNITADPRAGATADEVDDPRVWVEAIRQWSTFHPEFSFLPRKFKIAVTASPEDRAATKIYDIGLRLHRDEAGELAFEVMVGGGLGRTPYLGATIAKSLPTRHLLSYLQAILRVYNRYGRRDNIWKARIKVLVASLGAEAFAREVDAEWGKSDKAAVDLPDAELARIRAAFIPRDFETLPAKSAAFEAAKADPAFARFARHNVTPHKMPGYALVDVSLKKPGETPGDCSAEQMEAVADIAERYSMDETRVSYEQNLILPHVKLDDVPAVWKALDAAELATPNRGLVTDIIACPGLDYCALANARAIPIAQAIARKFADPALAERVGELGIKISGCINACGHHHVGAIGILGVDKKGEEYYQVTLGGSPEADAALGQALGPALPADRVADAVDQLVEVYLRVRKSDEPFLATFRRVGLAPFKEAVYADAHSWTGQRAEPAEDPFTTVDDEESIPQGDVIISLQRFLTEGRRLLDQGRRIGVRIEPSEDVEDLTEDLPRLALVALSFPKFLQGQHYSSARILRERLGFHGEVRAVGDVLREQARFMVRCGIDAFVPADGSSAADWTHVVNRFRHVYQRAADGRDPAFVERVGSRHGL